MNAFGLAFHHLGLATKTPALAAGFLKGLGYRIGPEMFDPQQNVNLMMCEHTTMPAVEIISPAGGKGPVSGLLATHSSGLIYHSCFTTDDLKASLQKLENAGLRILCVAPPKPALLFEERAVSFYQINGFGLIEILETRVS